MQFCIVKACATRGEADNGKEIHDDIARQGLQHCALMDVCARTYDDVLKRGSDALVTIYKSRDVHSNRRARPKCRELGKANMLLHMHNSRDVKI